MLEHSDDNINLKRMYLDETEWRSGLFNFEPWVVVVLGARDSTQISNTKKPLNRSEVCVRRKVKLVRLCLCFCPILKVDLMHAELFLET